jgi:hypothetical protein
VFSEARKPVTFSGMKNQRDKSLPPTLRDAYKVRGFRTRARIDSYDDLKYPSFVITLDRRSKKRSAAGAAKFVAAVTISAGGGLAILDAATEMYISISSCTA